MTTAPRRSTPPRIDLDGLERHDNPRFTRTIMGAEIGTTVFGAQFLSKRIRRIRRDLGARSDFQCPIGICGVKNKERAFGVHLQIFHFLARGVERQLDRTVIVEQKPECRDLRIAIWPNRSQHGHLGVEKILV